MNRTTMQPTITFIICALAIIGACSFTAIFVAHISFRLVVPVASIAVALTVTAFTVAVNHRNRSSPASESLSRTASVQPSVTSRKRLVLRVLAIIVLLVVFGAGVRVVYLLFHGQSDSDLVRTYFPRAALGIALAIYVLIATAKDS